MCDFLAIWFSICGTVEGKDHAYVLQSLIIYKQQFLYFSLAKNMSVNPKSALISASVRNGLTEND